LAPPPSQVDQIRLNQNFFLQNRIEHLHLQSTIRLGHRRFVVQAVTNKYNTFGPGLFVKKLPFPERTDIAIQNIDTGIRVAFLDGNGLGDGARATDSGAVRPVIIA
jgi:hypothetical protein